MLRLVIQEKKPDQNPTEMDCKITITFQIKQNSKSFTHPFPATEQIWVQDVFCFFYLICQVRVSFVNEIFYAKIVLDHEESALVYVLS